MKKIVICGMMLGLLTAVSWAQRGRPVARGPISGGRIGSVSPNVGMNPSAVSMSHGGIAPNAATRPNAVTTTGKNPNTVKPNATMDPTASTVGSHTGAGTPDRVITPDAHSGPPPER